MTSLTQGKGKKSYLDCFVECNCVFFLIFHHGAGHWITVTRAEMVDSHQPLTDADGNNVLGTILQNGGYKGKKSWQSSWMTHLCWLDSVVFSYNCCVARNLESTALVAFTICCMPYQGFLYKDIKLKQNCNNLKKNKQTNLSLEPGCSQRLYKEIKCKSFHPLSTVVFGTLWYSLIQKIKVPSIRVFLSKGARNSPESE